MVQVLGVYGLADVVVMRQACALSTHPDLEIGDICGALLLAHALALSRVEAVHGALDIEQDVDPADGLPGERLERERGQIIVGADMRKGANVISATNHPLLQIRAQRSLTAKSFPDN